MIQIQKYSKNFEDEYSKFISKKIKKRINKIFKMTCSEDIKIIINKYGMEPISNLCAFIDKRLEEFCIGNIQSIIESIKNREENLNISHSELKALYKYIFDYETFISKNKEFSYKIASEMNCKVCPFCNKNYTELLNKDNRKTLRYDFDHFYSKSKYPFLAVSIYNLLPICSGCNKIKNNIEFSIYNNMYPYIEGIENQITFGYELLEIGEYKIVNLSKNKKFNNNEKILQIVQKYNINLESAEIEKIFSKYNQYSSDAYNEYLRKTFDDIDEYERIEIIKKELGYTKIKDIKNKSFSKLRNDIIDSLFK